MAVQRIAVPESTRLLLRITARSSKVSVVAGDVDEVEVDGSRKTSVRVAESEDADTTEVRITSSSDDISVRCPEGADVVVGVNSGRVHLEGRFGDVRVVTRSGKVEVEEAASLDVRSGSGRITVGCCEGDCRVMSRSGSVVVERAGQLRAGTKSGRLEVKAVDAANVHAASGKVTLGATGRGDLEVKVMSGSVRIAVQGEARPQLRAKVLSGSVRNECEEGDDFRIDVKTLSGTVSVKRA